MANYNIIIKEPARQFLFEEINQEELERVMAVLENLKRDGHRLGRPYADTIHGSKFSNMKELRVSAKMKVFRLFYIFDPVRNAIILCGGDKKGKNEKRFYLEMIKLAEQTYQQYLDELENKNG